MAVFAPRFALEAQCAFLNWPVELNRVLEQWTSDNHEATRKQDRAAMAEVTREFDAHIRAVLTERRHSSTHTSDIAGELLREQVQGRALSDEEVVSILRNWTVGELATIAASVGILVHYLAAHSIVQQRLRENCALLPAAIDEILRIHPPLVASRRKATESVDVAGAHVGAGERITLMWASANRDEAVFGDPDEFRLDRDASTNLLYGAGIHVCPGAPLARLELRVLMEELLSATDWIDRDTATETVNAVYPASGFARVPVIICKS
jgi:cytochrome P450